MCGMTDSRTPPLIFFRSLSFSLSLSLPHTYTHTHTHAHTHTHTHTQSKTILHAKLKFTYSVPILASTMYTIKQSVHYKAICTL